MKDKRGLTLIEMLIVVALLAAVSLLMYSFFGQGLHLYAVESQSADEQANLRQVLSDITNRVRLTESDSITCDSGVLNVGDYAYQLDGNEIMRNGTAIARGMSSFTAVKSEFGILEISLVNTSGKSLSTAISLVE